MDLAKNAKLHRRIKTAVAQDFAGTHPEITGQIDTILANYTGDPRILETVMDNMGTDNPYQALANAVLRRAIFRTPSEIKKQMNDASIPVHGISVSGHRLTDQIFVLGHRYDPTVLLPFGAQAITKLTETFGTPELKGAFTSEGQTRIKRKKREQTHEAVQDIPGSLDEILADPSTIQDVPSREARIRIQSALNLDEEMAERLQQIDRVIYGNTTFVDQASNTYLLAAETTGLGFGWLKKKLKTLPHAIRDIYTTVTSPHVEIPEEERRAMMGALIAYIATNMPINRESAIGGYQRDLEFILNLPEDHPIRETHGEPDLGRVRDVLGKPEITLIEATKLFDVYPVDEVRVEINDSYRRKFKPEIDQALAELEGEFIVGGKWQEDSYGTSVPLGRLKETPYWKALTRDDFANVMNLLRARTISISDDRLLRGIEIGEFKALIDGVTKVRRHLTSQEAGETLRGNHYDIIENFEATYGIDLEGVMDRIQCTSHFFGSSDQEAEKLWERDLWDLKRASKYGLYSKKTTEDERFPSIIERAKDLIPYDGLEETTQKAREVLGNRLVVSHPFGIWLPNDNDKYTTIRQAENARTLAEVDVSETEEEWGDKLAPLLDQRDVLRESIFYTGSIGERLEVNGTKRYYDSFEEPGTEIQGIPEARILDPSGLETHFQTVTQGHARLDEVDDPEWRQKALYLASYDASPLLQTHGIQGATPKTYVALRDMQGSAYLEQELIRGVQEVYETLRSTPLNPEVDIETPDSFQTDELYNSHYTVTVQGTTRNDAGRFGPYMQGAGLSWTGQAWSGTNRSKTKVYDIANRIASYNSTHGTNLKVVVGSE